MNSNGAKKPRRRLLTIIVAVACIGCLSAFSLLSIKGASSDAAHVAMPVDGVAAGLVGFEFDESGLDKKGQNAANAAQSENTSEDIGLHRSGQIAQEESIQATGAWLPQGSYEERIALTKDMTATAGKPVATQGALSSLARSDMNSVFEEGEGSSYLTGQVLVLFAEGTDRDTAKSVLMENGLVADDQHIQDSLAAQAPLLTYIDSGDSVSAVLKKIESVDSAISYAQPNYVYAPMDQDTSANETNIDEKKLTPSANTLNEKELATGDTSLGEGVVAASSASSSAKAVTGSLLPALQATNVNDEKNYWNNGYYKKCDLQDAWDIVRCNGSVAVAVVDNGVADHPDLVDNIIPGTGYNSWYDNDNYQGMSKGYFVDGYHGTHVAGIVSARANNKIGIAGTSYNAGLIPIDVSYRHSNGFVTPTSSIANALSYLLRDADGNGKSDMVEKHNLRVVNISIGLVLEDPSDDVAFDRMVYPLIDKLYDQGVLVVCAAGNGGTQSFGTKNATWPADYEKCMSVINVFYHAGYEAFYRSGTSNYGDLKDISAPGESITSTAYNKNLEYNYTEQSGTSMASPAVAGMAALVFAANPALTPAQAKYILESTATDAGDPGFDVQFAWGVVNAKAAVQKAKETEGGQEPPVVDPTPPGGGGGGEGGDPVVPQPKTAVIPQAVKGLVYNGQWQTGVPEGEGYTTYSNHGLQAWDMYSALLRLNSGYVWSDGSTEDKRIPFRINPAPLTVVYAGENVRYGETPSYSVSVTGFISGEGPENAEDYVAPFVVPPQSLVSGSTYHLVPSGGSARNYSFNYVGGDLSVGVLPKEQTPSISINYQTEQLTGFSPSAEYIVNGSRYVVPADSIPIESEWFGNSISIVKAGNNTTTSNSAEAFVNVPERPSIPAGQLGAVNETIQGMLDGRITGVSDLMEYCKVGEQAWKACPGTVVEALSPGDYEVRLRATGISFAGTITTVHVGVGAERTCVLNVADARFATAIYGYGSQAFIRVSISNAGNSDAAIESIVLEGADRNAFQIAGGISSVTAGSSSDDLQMAPIEGLDAGEYYASIAVTYDGGKKAFGNVSFKVLQKPMETPHAYIDYETETFRGLVAGEIYILNQREFAAYHAQITIPQEMFGQTVSLVAKSGDANHSNSAALQITVPNRPDVPEVNARAESVKDKEDGAILGVTSRMEYRIDGEDTWKSCPGGDLEGLKPGLYFVRTKAGLSNFAGHSAELRVEAGKPVVPVEPVDPVEPIDPVGPDKPSSSSSSSSASSGSSSSGNIGSSAASSSDSVSSSSSSTSSSSASSSGSSNAGNSSGSDASNNTGSYNGSSSSASSSNNSSGSNSSSNVGNNSNKPNNGNSNSNNSNNVNNNGKRPNSGSRPGSPGRITPLLNDVAKNANPTSLIKEIVEEIILVKEGISTPLAGKGGDVQNQLSDSLDSSELNKDSAANHPLVDSGLENATKHTLASTGKDPEKISSSFTNEASTETSGSDESQSEPMNPLVIAGAAALTVVIAAGVIAGLLFRRSKSS